MSRSKQFAYFNKHGEKGIARDTIPSHCTILLTDLMLDGYTFANVHAKGIVAFKH